MLPYVAVIVPVMRRPQNAVVFMDSLLESTDRAEVVIVADKDDEDTWRAWLKELGPGDGRVIRSTWPAPGGTFAQKVNLGFRSAPWTDWIFICGDDVRFTPGWVEAAIDGSEAQVVGTCAPGVSDDWSPHLFLRRQYVERIGASWDGPGVICHEGYRHNYVDVEICAVARQRGVWSMAWDSVVEHLHPAFGKGNNDPTYQLGQQSVDVDAALWTRREREFAGVPA